MVQTFRSFVRSSLFIPPSPLFFRFVDSDLFYLFWNHVCILFCIGCVHAHSLLLQPLYNTNTNTNTNTPTPTPTPPPITTETDAPAGAKYQDAASMMEDGPDRYSWISNIFLAWYGL